MLVLYTDSRLIQHSEGEWEWEACQRGTEKKSHWSHALYTDIVTLTQNE